MKIIRALHNSPVQGHPDLKKMLHELRKKYNLPSSPTKVQTVIEGCENCMKSKSVKESQLRPPLQKIYDPFDGAEDMLEIDIVCPHLELFYAHSDGSRRFCILPVRSSVKTT